MRFRFFFISFLLAALLPGFCFANIGAEWNPTGDPIGGGPGYSDSVRPQDAEYIVRDKAQLLSALYDADYGDVIYIWDTCSINMTGSMYTIIPAGVTLASGRGRVVDDSLSWGALVYFNEPNCNNGDIFTLSDAPGKVRVTGLRFRGSYSELEGCMTPADTFAEPVPWEAGIGISRDSCEIDNCEFWGFGKTPVSLSSTSRGTYIHHCYVHHQRHIYHGYGFNFAGPSSGIVEACYFDHIGPGVSGSVDTNSHFEARYNISGRHGGANVYERHNNCGYPPYSGADYIHHNTIRYNGPHITTYVICGGAVDSVFVHSNWCWAQDSAHSFQLYSDSLIRIWDNHFTSNPPQQLLARLPNAVITSDVDSGNPPLTITLSAVGSNDPDGTLTAFYWHFGDSCETDNWQRHTDIDYPVQYTYDQIGTYTVTLMVVDNDGISSYAYKTINVVPYDVDHSYLSCWIKDRFHGKPSGYYSKQILLNDWICWEKDVAGGGTWEHVIVDITDSLAEWQLDSVTLAFRLYCDRDTSQYSIGWLKMLIDDVVMYGADVKNGNFESGTWTWTGTGERTDGYWIPSCNHNGYAYREYDWYQDVNGGLRSFHLGKRNYPHTAGNWAQVSQKVSVSSMGFTSPDPGGSEVCSLYAPYPNPAKSQMQFGYKLSAKSMVSVDIYDATGRFVRSMGENKQSPGQYYIYWDGKDYTARDVANGVYFIRFSIDGATETKQVVWLR